MAFKKATKAEIQRRIKDVARLLIECKTSKEIILYCADTYQIGERQTTNYIKRANKFVSESVSKDFQKDFAFCVKRYLDLYNLAYQNNDLRLCRQINKDLSELGELSKQQVEHSGNITFISNIER